MKPNRSVNIFTLIIFMLFLYLYFLIASLKIYNDALIQAWTLWKEGKALELLDTSILENSNHHREEIMRCIQVGLLSVQDRPDDRPDMSAAMLMLSSRDAVVPQPKQPAYFSERGTSDIESSSCYDTTLTIVEPR